MKPRISVLVRNICELHHLWRFRKSSKISVDDPSGSPRQFMAVTAEIQPLGLARYMALHQLKPAAVILALPFGVSAIHVLYMYAQSRVQSDGVKLLTTSMCIHMNILGLVRWPMDPLSSLYRPCLSITNIDGHFVLTTVNSNGINHN